MRQVLRRAGDWSDRISTVLAHVPRMGDYNYSRVFLHDYQDYTFLLLSSLSSALALNPTATLVPSVLALALLRTYAVVLFPSNHAKSKIAAFLLAISVGSAIPHFTASQQALSTSALSFILLASVSSLTSALVVGSLFVDWQVSRKYPGTALAIFFFPALWATLWRTITYTSPVGNILSWSRPRILEGYQWLIPLVGPASQDWITAAWAVVLSLAFQSWYMGPPPTDDDELLEPVTLAERRTHTSPSFLGASLLALLVPSFFVNQLPLPVADVDHATPFGVGCILPTFDRYKRHVPTLTDYINESKKLQNSARLLLWPEGAVSFASDEERNKAFEYVRGNITGSYVGVSFNQVAADPNDPSGRKGYERTGIAVVGKDSEEPYLLYYKRHLVPIAESYRLVPSTEPPTLANITIPTPKGIPPSRWDPSPSHARPLSITASVCLDFAFPNNFDTLSSRPGLILAPAKTWERSVGISMWLQAKQRAAELNSMVLWCDGGDDGVSGIGGGGFDDPQQVGPGSWVKTIGIQYPFNDKRTVYALLEDSSVLFYWLLAGSSLVTSGIPDPFEPPRLYLAAFDTSLNKKPAVRTTGFLLASPSRLGLSVYNVVTESSDPVEICKRPPRRFISSKELDAVQKDTIDDFHIITNDDLHTPRIPAEPLEQPKASPLNLKTSEDFLSARPISLGPISAHTELSSAPSELADIAANFPPPPTHIPSPRTAQHPSTQPFAPAIEATQSQAPTSRSIDRFTANLKRILKRSLRIPSLKRSAPNPDPLTAAPPIPTASNTEASLSHPPQPALATRRLDDDVPEPLFQVSAVPSLTYDFVDPATLTATPAVHATSDLLPSSSSATFLPQSPSCSFSDLSRPLHHITAPLASQRTRGRRHWDLEVRYNPGEPYSTLCANEFPPVKGFFRHCQHRVFLHQRSHRRVAVGTPITMDYTGKRNDVIDYGGEYDYSNQNWFQDAPPRPEPPPPAPSAPPYVPSQSVIEQNEAFLFALENAPNILYARFKQYGQLGVLGWCSEFGELIDHLKDLGFAGNMFVSTRTQALKACEDILKLNLDIKMQIIVMYLSYQVARLRRFLDGDRVWTDYPEPQFPLNPTAG
ncbi:hypothetical protein CC1G_13700 [Coprinopsis cinerea okayama7|uniref:CN hydrolase domain-containing protein n=1 Tax=Coprinopsis cinerea (strain Okayama-7 / 130 / ATCC MYA-4618 / FGSC 9003) TaxID=240176 RepID=D6RK17_COPC7|nr:hypothetical protein CC1G_13700 [Coprinopsis cinerea okayama7\|eukprot:XP_002912168.1 hypothetical protein CC1G_13700 [Coprinopsis cinerea okayama7\